MSTAEKTGSRREEALFAINVEAAKEIARGSFVCATFQG